MKQRRFYLGILLAVLSAILFLTCGRKEPTEPTRIMGSPDVVSSISDTSDTTIVPGWGGGQDTTGPSSLEPIDSVGGVPCLFPPWPDTLLGVLARAYRERSVGLIEASLADDFQFRDEDGEVWDKTTECMIHQRMFDPDYPRYGAKELSLSLTNPTWGLVDSPASASRLYELTCDVSLRIECPQGPSNLRAESRSTFIVRRVESAPAKWQIVSWYDYPKEDWR